MTQNKDLPEAAALAPRAEGDDETCHAMNDDDTLICLAAKGHAGDHVPYGAMNLRAHTWPQDAEAQATLAATGLARPPSQRCSVCGEYWGDDPECNCRCTTGTPDPLAALADSVPVAAARDILARIDAICERPEVGLDEDSRPLSSALRAVLAEIDKAAGR